MSTSFIRTAGYVLAAVVMALVLMYGYLELPALQASGSGLEKAGGMIDALRAGFDHIVTYVVSAAVAGMVVIFATHGFTRTLER